MHMALNVEHITGAPYNTAPYTGETKKKVLTETIEQ